MKCWCGYLSEARCRLFAYGPADVADIPNSHHLLPHLNPEWFYLSAWCRLISPGCPGKKAVKRVWSVNWFASVQRSACTPCRTPSIYRMACEPSSVDRSQKNRQKLVATAQQRPSRDQKTNFRSFIYSQFYQSSKLGVDRSSRC